MSRISTFDFEGMILTVKEFGQPHEAVYRLRRVESGRWEAAAPVEGVSWAPVDDLGVDVTQLEQAYQLFLLHSNPSVPERTP